MQPWVFDDRVPACCRVEQDQEKSFSPLFSLGPLIQLRGFDQCWYPREGLLTYVITLRNYMTLFCFVFL